MLGNQGRGVTIGWSNRWDNHLRGTIVQVGRHRPVGPLDFCSSLERDCNLQVTRSTVRPHDMKHVCKRLYRCLHHRTWLHMCTSCSTVFKFLSPKVVFREVAITIMSSVVCLQWALGGRLDSSTVLRADTAQRLSIDTVLVSATASHLASIRWNKKETKKV